MQLQDNKYKHTQYYKRKRDHTYLPFRPKADNYFYEMYIIKSGLQYDIYVFCCSFMLLITWNHYHIIVKRFYWLLLCSSRAIYFFAKCALLNLPNNVWGLIVFALFLLLIIIILLSFRATWMCLRQISETTGQNFMKLGGVIDICF